MKTNNQTHSNIDILCIGDCVIDLFMRVENNYATSENGKICFLHGSKVLVNEIATYVGGNAYNASVGLAKLGVSTSIYSVIGVDEYTQRIEAELTAKKINTIFLQKAEHQPNNVHTVIAFQDERTIFAHHENRVYKLPEIQAENKPKIIYYTSLGYGFEHIQAELVEYLNQNKETMLIFNPGTIQLKSGVHGLANILRKTDILILNKEEAQDLVSTTENATIELHKDLQSLGPKLTVITDATEGSSAYDGRSLETTGIYDDNRQLKDKTGAGDAYAAGFVAGIFYKKSLKECLIWGMINSGNKVKETGATNGTCTKEQIEDLLTSL